MENKKIVSAIVNLINERLNNATPGTAVFTELTHIKNFIYQNLLLTRMNADMNDEIRLSTYQNLLLTKMNDKIEDKKLYTFICNDTETEIGIVIASSLDDACEIFKRNRQNDKVTQFIHRYGDFHYDEAEKDVDKIKEREEKYLSLWDVSQLECMGSGEKDGIKYYEYENSGDWWEWYRLTIIEQPLKEYNMIVSCDENDILQDMYDVLQEIESYEAKIKTADIENVVQLIEESIRDNDKIVEILSNKDIIHPLQYDFIDEFSRYMTLPVYEKLNLFNLLKGLRIKYPDIKFEVKYGFTIEITFENLDEFDASIRLYDKYIEFYSEDCHDIRIDITSNNDFNVISDSLIAGIDKAIQTYLSWMKDNEKEE